MLYCDGVYWNDVSVTLLEWCLSVSLYVYWNDVSVSLRWNDVYLCHCMSTGMMSICVTVGLLEWRVCDAAGMTYPCVPHRSTGMTCLWHSVGMTHPCVPRRSTEWRIRVSPVGLLGITYPCVPRRSTGMTYPCVPRMSTWNDVSVCPP